MRWEEKPMIIWTLGADRTASKRVLSNQLQFWYKKEYIVLLAMFLSTYQLDENLDALAVENIIALKTFWGKISILIGPSENECGLASQSQ